MALLGGEELNALTERIIGHAYVVWNELGFGFLEKVYENALAFSLRSDGIAVETQKPIAVQFRGQVVGEYVADALVQAVVLLELKSCKVITEAHKAQCLNYLKATGLKTCLLINFGPEGVQIKRFRK
ncbi:MAG: GxxExxY protein [Phycisphaeraceae bacterium]